MSRMRADQRVSPQAAANTAVNPMKELRIEKLVISA